MTKREPHMEAIISKTLRIKYLFDSLCLCLGHFHILVRPNLKYSIFIGLALLCHDDIFTILC